MEMCPDNAAQNRCADRLPAHIQLSVQQLLFTKAIEGHFFSNSSNAAWGGEAARPMQRFIVRPHLAHHAESTLESK